MNSNRLCAIGILIGSASYALAQLEITRSTVDGGGVMRSTGGDFELSGTLGQPDTGVMTGGAFELTGGFWFAIGPGDCNETGTTNLFDLGAFGDCAEGPDSSPASGPCRCFDLDASGFVDLGDFAVFQTVFAH